MEKQNRLRFFLSGAILLFLAALVIVLLSSNAFAASSIYGTVTDAETEDPISGADVYIYETGNEKGNSHKAETDRQGDYAVDLEPGNYQIKISKDGYETHEGEEDVGIEEQVEHNAKLEPKEATYLEGVVTDEDSGNPVSGAEVSISYDTDKGKKAFSGSTDRRGYYNISCEEGNYDIKISHTEYETHEGTVNIKTGGNRYDASLTPGNGGGGDGTDRDTGTDDEDAELSGGQKAIMASGWVVAAGLLGIVIFLMKKDGEEREKVPRTGAGSLRDAKKEKKRSSSDQESRCPNCKGPGFYYEKYQDYYCKECEDYFKDMK